MASPEVLIFDLFGTLVFFDDSRVPTLEVAGRQVPVTVEGLPLLLDQLLPQVGVDEFLRELRAAGVAVLEQKRREGVELHTSVRFERALLALGSNPAAANAGARRMATLHMETLARAVVCPPGRDRLLARLSATHRLALLSNFDDGATGHRIVEAAGLAPFFEAIVISEEEGLRKPSRQIFERTCRRLGADAASCLYIGDTLVEDIQGATDAGLSALWIHPDADAASPAQAVLSDVEALPEWLEGRAVSGPDGAR